MNVWELKLKNGLGENDIKFSVLIKQDAEEEVPDTPEARELVRQFTQKRAQRTKELEQINKLIENNQRLRDQMNQNDHKMQEQMTVS